MIQEDKELLLRYLCTALPYGVYVEHTPTGIRGKLNNISVIHKYNDTNSVQEVEANITFFGDCYIDVVYLKPYLRPMSSITKEEKEEIKPLFSKFIDESGKRVLVVRQNKMALYQDYLNAHHLDYRGLIPKGLAIEVTEENNPY